MSRQKMDFDIIIIGAGPAGLAAAIKLAQLSEQKLNICVLEKASEVGAHILSGAVLDPRALDELIPNWLNLNPPSFTPVTAEQFLFLIKNKSYHLPLPKIMRNKGNYIISLGAFCRWLARYAEDLGVNIIAGFAATEILYQDEKVCGIVTGDKGIDKEGKPTPLFQAGIELYAKQVFFAEGCRGSLSETVIKKYDLRKNASPQTYALGIKELWQIPKDLHQAGEVIHTLGWPLDSGTYGGGFLYHFEENLLSLGLVVGLDYKDPYLNPYEELQLFKSHPKISTFFKQGKRIQYGARTLNEGGWQSIPTLYFPGGVLIGCAAGLVNVPKIKGIHNAMKSGILAAISFFEQPEAVECKAYPKNLRESWIFNDLYPVRNIRPAMRWGLGWGLAYAALDYYIFRGKTPWTFKNKNDYQQTHTAAAYKPRCYPKHDQVISFDLMSSVFLAKTQHNENQPCHLKLVDSEVAVKINLGKYAGLEQRYCPAGVYEFRNTETTSPYLQINSANCIHCKACDIKDPSQNIKWIPPEGGSGPHYDRM